MRQMTLRQYKERMLRVLVHIQSHLDEELALEDLAGIACFSMYHFHRIFRGMIGESVKEHIRRLRLERAASSLKHSDSPIVTIALEAGYESHEAFTRAFKAMTGESPSQFRLREGSWSRPDAPSGLHYREGKKAAELHSVQSGGVSMEVKIETLKPMRVAFVRHIGPYDQCGTAWDRLTGELGRRGILGADTRFIGLCYDDPDVTPPEKIRYDACVTVGEDFEPEDDIGVQTIAGGKYAVTTHFGPYSRIGETYSKLLGEWLPRSRREVRSIPCLEVYLTDPEGTDPEDYLTDIYAPLEPS